METYQMQMIDELHQQAQQRRESLRRDMCKALREWWPEVAVKTALKRIPGVYQRPLSMLVDQHSGWDEVLRAAYEWTSTFQPVRDYGTQRGIILAGPCGCGKSVLAGAMAMELARAGRYIAWINPAAHVQRVYQSMNDTWDWYEAETLERLRAADLLVLDDLGADSSKPDAASRIYSIIEEAHTLQIPMIVTANYDVPTLARRMGDQGQRIVSRLAAATGDFAAIPAQDWRIQRRERESARAGV